MSASQSLSGQSRCGRVIGPSLDKIIKNTTWKKHSPIVSARKSTLDKLETIPRGPALADPPSPLLGLSLSDADFVLQPMILALDSTYFKIVEPTLECAFRLFSLNLVHAEIGDGDGSTRG